MPNQEPLTPSEFERLRIQNKVGPDNFDQFFERRGLDIFQKVFNRPPQDDAELAAISNFDNPEEAQQIENNPVNFLQLLKIGLRKKLKTPEL